MFLYLIIFFLVEQAVLNGSVRCVEAEAAGDEAAIFDTAQTMDVFENGRDTVVSIVRGFGAC
jgi:hypothetical protein